jgi:hypothetical protein
MQKQITHAHGQSIDEFLMKEANIIDNDIMLDATNYFTIDHELEY